ncbi:hypothetical protein CLOSTMETH_00263 [[Clostridium] methylpentosum DSM 5476]|uniref:Uncharacterized protein n=1 Tax=[Clostridium] methylpentosum DSM 5476 TaxID=537013 RepID=C0E8W8_9FIRM|nr:hypothetical protein CLOSTMETH_00263 [[Clostridium] methylpentosum DSM 5476]
MCHLIVFVACGSKINYFLFTVLFSSLNESPVSAPSKATRCFFCSNADAAGGILLLPLNGPVSAAGPENKRMGICCDGCGEGIQEGLCKNLYDYCSILAKMCQI